MCNKEGEINMKEMTNSNTNVFLDVLYNKPILDPSAGFFKKIAYKFKLRKYTRENFTPLYENIRCNNLSFVFMVDLSDFIKSIEKVFHYKNDIKENSNDIKLLSDNKWDKDDQVKSLIIADTLNNAVTTIELSRESVGDDYKDIVQIVVKNNFGKKLQTKFTIINTEVKIDNRDDYNLLFNINKQLRDLSSELFKKYYELA